MNEWLPEIDIWREAGEKIVTATVVNVNGSAPRPVGALLAVIPDGRMAGSVSGGCVESSVITTALEVHETGQPRLEHFGITEDMAFEVGLSCGGNIDVWVAPLPEHTVLDEARERQRNGENVAVVTWLDASGRQQLLTEYLWRQSGTYELDGERVYVELFRAPNQLVIFGAVHVAQTLAHYAMDLGFEVSVVDARTALATRERFPDVKNLLAMWPNKAYEQLNIQDNTWIAVLSHDPKFDEPAILGALNTNAVYIGAQGNRKTSEERLDRLREMGVGEDQLARIHGPIGLNIGGKTPQEMAISILAEMIAVGNNRDGGMLNTAKGHITGVLV